MFDGADHDLHTKWSPGFRRIRSVLAQDEELMGWLAL
jgi:hypothetical protein